MYFAIRIQIFVAKKKDFFKNVFQYYSTLVDQLSIYFIFLKSSPRYDSEQVVFYNGISTTNCYLEMINLFVWLSIQSSRIAFYCKQTLGHD
jgi:hypothetical protein